MTEMTQFRRNKCLQIIERLAEKDISSVFLKMVDPIADGVPDYPKYIQNPMALNEVKSKLTSNSYKTVKDFEDDVELIWSNARTFNGVNSPVDCMAQECARIFRKKMKKLPANKEQEWTLKIQKIVKQFEKAVMNPPIELASN